MRTFVFGLTMIIWIIIDIVIINIGLDRYDINLTEFTVLEQIGLGFAVSMALSPVTLVSLYIADKVLTAIETYNEMREWAKKRDGA